MNQQIIVESPQVVISLEEELENCQHQVKQIQLLLQSRICEEINELYEVEKKEFEKISRMFY